MRRTLLVAISLLGASLLACEARKPSEPAAGTGGTRVTVLAAASLADAFREAGASFEAANHGTKVEFSFAGSNQLRTQLEHGAPGDVFASADRKQMDAATAAKVVDGTTVRVFARNRLALIVPKANKAGIASLADLAKPGVKIVVADKAVPVGNYTRLMLDSAQSAPGFGETFVKAFDANTVSREENVAAVVTKVALGEADAGIAYASDAAGGNADRLTIVPIPDALDQQAQYVCAVTARAANKAQAARFVEFLLSPAGQKILVKCGFLGVPAP